MPSRQRRHPHDEARSSRLRPLSFRRPAERGFTAFRPHQRTISLPRLPSFFPT
jgi:hypothetical protein